MHKSINDSLIKSSLKSEKQLSFQRKDRFLHEVDPADKFPLDQYQR